MLSRHYTPDFDKARCAAYGGDLAACLTFQKCGVMLTVLRPAERVRRDLFEARDPVRQARLMLAVDRLNENYGSRTVHFGDVGGEKAKAAMRSGFRSGNFITAWGELPVVR